MNNARATQEIRLWPGFVLVALQWLAAFGTGLVAPSTPLQFFGLMLGPLVGLLGILIWWFFASRAPRRERWIGALLPIAGFVLAFVLAHKSAPTAIFTYGIPFYCLLFVIWAWVSRRWSPDLRRDSLIGLILVATLGWTLLRSEGVDGNMATDISWRWSATAEERLLATDVGGSSVAPAGDLVAGSGELAWPGFRGPGRDSVVPDLRIATDWSATSPKLLWKQPVGPGWGSFAVAGDLLLTQEQRGEEETVSAYRASTGEVVWQHRDRARFWEALAGAGPRATPEVAGDRVFSLGATGLLNALDLATGAPLWQRDIAADTGATVPDWGFASSPLVIDGRVVVYSGAADGKAVAAYRAEDGEPSWFAPAGPLSYSSLHRVTLEGVEQLLILTGGGATSLAPGDGAVLWQHDWPAVQGGARVVQPALTTEGGVLIGTGFGQGVRLIEVENGPAGWQTTERWTSRGMKPYYNDFVVHKDHIYGFDGRILVCLDLATGERAWKGGRYGNGQLLLLPDQDLLLVLSDRGQLALVEARPEGFTELASIEAIEGKTWNHPAIADGVLYVRNGEEMAAFDLPGVGN